MKKIFSAFLVMMTLLISSVTTAQTPAITGEYLGLPQEVVDAANTTVFTSSANNFFEIIPTTSTSIKAGVKTVKKGYAMRLKKQNGSGTAYGLNLVYWYAHDYNCAYKGQNDTSFIFQSPSQTAYLTTSGTVHRFTVVSKISERKFHINGKWESFTRERIDSICKASLKYDITTLENKCKQVWTGGAKDPAVWVTNIFGVIERNGDQYTNKTLINGRLYSTFSYQSLKTPWGGNLGELSFSWVVYNGCEVPAVKPTDGNSTGNFGECFRRMYSSFQPQSQSITITSGSSFSSNAQGNIVYDSSKPVIVQLVVHRHPMPEKNTEQEGYFNPATGERVYKLF